MKSEIKIVIQKIRGFSNGNWFRYYTVDKIKLEDMSSILTEAEFCWYIYRRFGEGRYMCTATQKGHKGFWIYWIGWLSERGFTRDSKRDREEERLRKEFARADSSEERERIREYMGVNEEKAVLRNSACHELVKFRAGVFHGYSEELNESQMEAYLRKRDSARRRY